MALASRRPKRARELCEKMLGYASSLQLYAEEIDARSGRHLGNFPQAFTHLALINAVMHVIRADQALASRQQPLDARRSEHRSEGNGTGPTEELTATPLEELTPRASGAS